MGFLRTRQISQSRNRVGLISSVDGLLMRWVVSPCAVARRRSHFAAVAAMMGLSVGAPSALTVRSIPPLALAATAATVDIIPEPSLADGLLCRAQIEAKVRPKSTFRHTKRRPKKVSLHAQFGMRRSKESSWPALKAENHAERTVRLVLNIYKLLFPSRCGRSDLPIHLAR